MAIRIRQRRQREDTSVQLFRPRPGNDDAIHALLQLANPTKQDVFDRLNGSVSFPPRCLTENEKAYYARRAQIYQWAAQVETGGAHIDEHDRLVLATAPEPLPPVNQEPVDLRHPEAEDDEERRWLQQEERDAVMAISKAVKRYRQQGVPEEDFQLIHVPTKAPSSSVNYTFRRVCFAILAVVTAFACIMLQTLPLLNYVTPSNLVFDKLIVELLQVRHFRQHAVHCTELNRDDTPNWLFGNAPAINCAKGVLHIPSKFVVLEEYLKASSQREMDALENYIAGVNVTWFMPCHAVDYKDRSQNVSSYPGSSMYFNRKCFRGVHDGLLTGDSVESALQMGEALIKAGSDHFDIREDVHMLTEMTPRLLEAVELLLKDVYGLSEYLFPVAYRIHVTLPMDAKDVIGEKSSKLLSKNFNKTNYVNWLNATKRHNEDALYSIGPFGKEPIRDPCKLMADMEADPRFGIHTSIFLSDGAGKDFAGGVALYVDEHNSNSNPRRRIQRGVSIDGHRGRIVVSTGGLENRRCRLPTRAGIRAVLQIWWDTGNASSTCDTITL